jgi:hypothetical protein
MSTLEVNAMAPTAIDCVEISRIYEKDTEARPFTQYLKGVQVGN